MPTKVGRSSGTTASAAAADMGVYVDALMMAAWVVPGRFVLSMMRPKP